MAGYSLIKIHETRITRLGKLLQNLGFAAVVYQLISAFKLYNGIQSNGNWTANAGGCYQYPNVVIGSGHSYLDSSACPFDVRREIPH